MQLRSVAVLALALSGVVAAETVELKPGSSLPGALVKGKTNLVEFYATW